MTVQSILSLKGHDVVTGRPDMTLGEVCAALAQHKIGALVMLDDRGKIRGIVSERDIVRVLAKHGAEVLSRPASEHMTKSVVTCKPTDTVNEVMGKMTHGRFRHVPVVSEGKLVGVVSIGDLVKHRIAEIEREAEEMRTYIATA